MTIENQIAGKAVALRIQLCHQYLSILSFVSVYLWRMLHFHSCLICRNHGYQDQSFISCNFYRFLNPLKFLKSQGRNLIGSVLDIHIPNQINCIYKYDTASGGHADITKEGFQEKCKINTDKDRYRDPLQTMKCKYCKC